MFLDHRLRIPLLVLGLALGRRWFTVGDHPVGSLEANVAAALTARTGAVVGDPRAEVVALDPVSDGLLASTRTVRFAALARPVGGRFRDLYRMEARVAGNGGVVELGWAVNLTRSSDADDAALFAQGQRVATLVTSEGALAAVEVRDFAGDGDPTVASWPLLQRVMAGVTNVEQTGAWEGVALAHHDVAAPGRLAASGRLDGDALIVGDAVRVPLDGSAATAVGATSGSVGALTLAPRDEKMQMDLLNWVADRGRGFADQGLAPAWLGTSVELAKEVYFQAKEVKASVEELAPEPENTVEQPPAVVAEVQHAAVEKALELARIQARTSDFPWPPPPVAALLSPALEGEGLWVPVPSGWSDGRDDTPLLYTTFVRPSGEYARKAVRLFAWDPRRAELRMRAGTHEPVPQTAAKGDGRMPRDKALLERVVLAFNGGFQTTHRAFGMMVDEKVLLKPRTYGATIGLLADGRPAFGTWAKGAEIPEELVSWRQNLEPLIEDGVFNAYRRVRFGAHENVAGAKDGWTVRSALCHTPEGHLIYAYAEYTNERALALALKQAGCTYAIHLDMNPGHTGIERYRHLSGADAAEVPENVRDVEGVPLEGVLGHANVRHMNRPTRYLGTDYRDFFYLVRKDTLPGPALTGLSEGAWLTGELPGNHDLPPRVAVGNAAGLTVVQLDLDAVALSTDTPTLEAEAGAMPMLSVPLGCSGARTVTLGPPGVDGASPTQGLALSGAAPGDGVWVALPPARTLPAPVGAPRDPRAAVVLGVTAANRAVAEQILARLGLEAALGCTGDGAVWAYDRDPQGRLVELTPGDDRGAVVEAPSAVGTRLWVYPAARPPRVVRYWPDANPYRQPASTPPPAP